MHERDVRSLKTAKTGGVAVFKGGNQTVGRTPFSFNGSVKKTIRTPRVEDINETLSGKLQIIKSVGSVLSAFFSLSKNYVPAGKVLGQQDTVFPIEYAVAVHVCGHLRVDDVPTGKRL